MDAAQLQRMLQRAQGGGPAQDGFVLDLQKLLHFVVGVIEDVEARYVASIFISGFI